MKIEYANPRDLVPNPWNPNVVDPVNEEKLVHSMRLDGMQKAILVRTLHDGTMEILDGQHRTQAAITLGWDEVAVVNLGLIEDGEAKKQTLIGNSRYGDDDPLLMANLLSDEDLGEASLLLSTLPIDEHTLESYFKHLEIDLENIDLGDVDADNDLGIKMDQKVAHKTHNIMRFKVSVEDCAKLQDRINRVKREQGFTESDELTNAGDALVFLLREDAA